MGCDIHTTVCVRDKDDSGLFKPIFGTIIGASSYFYRHYIEPRYFRNYDIFGILTEESVRGGTILNDFEQEIPDNFDSALYCLPIKGKFPFAKIKWTSVGFNDEPLFASDITLDQASEIWNHYVLGDEEKYRMIQYCVPTNALEYYCSENVHSHNYFTVKQLKKLIKKLYTLSTDTTLNALTQANIKNTADFLNEYKKDIMSIARLSNGFYDKIDDEDVLVLICFDS